MKIYIEQSDLQNAIEKAEKVLRKATLPIMDSVLLSAKNGKITVTTNNLESAIIVETYGSILEMGSILIDKSNFKLIKKLSGKLYISDENDIVKISGNRELKFKQCDPTAYPEVRTEFNHEAFTIAENEFKDSLKIKVFAGDNEARPVLCSLCINKNRIIALDGYRLAKVDLNIDNNCNQDIIIPVQAIIELDKILNKKSNKCLKFEYFSKETLRKEEIQYLKITGEDWQYITRLVEGEYFNIDNVIPVDFNFNIDVDKDSFNESVQFAKEILADKKPVVFDITKDFIISGASADKEFSEVISENINTSNSNYIKTGFDPKYLIDIFKTIPDEKIKLNFGDNANRPLVITGNKTINETYMICPIKLNHN